MNVVSLFAPVVAPFLSLFNPPADAPPKQVRLHALKFLAVGVVLMALTFWVTPMLMQVKSVGGQFGIYVVIFVYGLGFLVLPASLFRLIFTTPSADGGLHFGRSLVAIALFLVTSVASCLIYGQLTR